jgi:predicted enzyme related to lactoylglutathione lyase
MSSTQGRVVWHDLMSSNRDGALEFYTKLLGWTLTTWDMAPEPYHMFTNDGKTLGGAMPLPEEAKKMGAPSHWIMYVSVDDVDASAAMNTTLGGKTYVPPTDVPTVGKFAILGDPQGVTYAIFKAAPGGSIAHQGGVGEFSWHELLTNDQAKAFEYYQKMFGWKKRESHDMGPMGVYQLWGLGDDELGGMMNKPKDMPMGFWNCYIRVADLDKTVAEVTKLGGQVLNGPMEVPGGDRIAQCMDNAGAMFSLHGKK